ncbi:dicarboxylate/amino acid:cation symporter [Shewanella sp. C32]|uniref:Dicarboxylate/amino acid:cation symporter n=1 Tax=Shewanella electrica TaxID=515560 RepID=A0ABT2FHP1_9GAMM|nr:dicarboxylate/amino acid:cation symporter [Shewanella electrica]MCH1923944.1 dicarboxylate/amino acid:cation symporter [Shewanella electrica]MCS4555847.1 dicarboxylate/amino acid:cation symporter [Shewanella electrica]
MNFKKLLSSIGMQVVIAMLIGAVVGHLMGADAAVFAPLGTLFISLIKMLVIPLVLVAIIVGAASLGDSPSAGKIGITTFAFFLITSALAVVLALLLGYWFQPGVTADFSSVTPTSDMIQVTAADGHIAGPVDTIIGMIPTNVFESMTSGNIIQILVFSIFFGIALTKVKGDGAKQVQKGLSTVLEALVWMITKVMIIAPLGVFGLMAEAVGTYGFERLEVVLNLFWIYVAGILIFGFVVYPLLVHFLSPVSARRFIFLMKKPQVMALSTASSMATLPVNMQTVEEELKVSNATASFVLPLGATINMSGNAIYYGLVAIFFAQMYQVDLGIMGYAAIILTSTLGAIGQAGVPGPTFLVVAVLMSAGIPIDGLPLLFALDRIFDMIRTALNITGDAACAVIVDKFAPKDVA